MARWQVAYWGEHGVHIYHVDKSAGVSLLYSGELSALKKIKGSFCRRVLIVGRSRALRIRKRYPPLTLEKLTSAVRLEASSLFPIEDCALHCRIVQSYSTHVIADIWAWEKEPMEKIQAVFPFRFVVPEDLAYLSRPPGLSIYPDGDIVHVVAAGGGKFLDAASYPASSFSGEDLNRFFAGLAEHCAMIREIHVAKGLPADVPEPFRPLIKTVAAGANPPYLAAVTGVRLNSFREKGRRRLLLPDKTAIIRFALYGALAYGLTLFLTIHHYDGALADLKDRSLKLDSEITLLDSRQGEEETDVIHEAVSRQMNAVSPLHVLDVLAAELPEETYIKSLVFNQGVIEATVVSSDPLALLKKLSASKRIAGIGLKGSPVRDSSSGSYNSHYLLEIRP